MLKEAASRANNVKNNILNQASTTQQKASTSIKNLKVNEKKIYETTKSGTELVLNVAGHGVLAFAITNLAFATNQIFLLAACGFVLVKTIQHGIKSTKELLKEKNKIR